jgi:hypothetical protein
MTYTGAIVVGAGLLAGALILTGSGQSQTPTQGKYVGAGVSESGGTAWRVDTQTGEMAYCTVAGTGGTRKTECFGPNGKIP